MRNALSWGMNANTSREEQIMDQRIKVMVFDSGRTDYSCWGNVDFPSNAEALRARDALGKVLRAEGAVIQRRALPKQVRPHGARGGRTRSPADEQSRETRAAMRFTAEELAKVERPALAGEPGARLVVYAAW